ncbi:MAG: tRNA (adenosine(37)-N6)-dimethylallyltransferase MiaA [Candidatus Zixiibacteriota bacterium]|nr:MAG: tRNA (adenosine(37)-N6)-dimethylallyltransferase MiaA [candidate division Zixibacteria bacterium]
MAELTPITVICGPTGAGKTAAALELAEQYQVEIVNADSRQIIRHLNIGTAKPTAEERQQARFHLLDLVEPGERYSAYRFIEDASGAIRDILACGKIPVMVGGTGLYLRALSEGVIEIPRSDPTVRERLEAEMQELGPEAMHERLKQVDPVEAAGLHPNNRVRVIRALEILGLTGKTKTELAATDAYKRCEYDFDFHCLAPDRARLYDRINTRVNAMMAYGLLQEVQDLVNQGLRDGIRKANVIGYSELLDHLEGALTLDEAVEKIKQNTRRYAKRQMTWFRNQTESKFHQTTGSLLEAVRFD